MPNKAELLELAAKVMKRVVITENGCHEWQGAHNSNGYGQVWYSKTGSKLSTHRIMYQHAKGEIPSGLYVDHLCRNPPCCNPDHLEAVTPSENIRRGHAGLTRRLAGLAVRHCPAGHEYTTENTYICRRGRKSCKACSRARNDAMRARRPLTPKSIIARKWRAERKASMQAAIIIIEPDPAQQGDRA